jgi:hypothetical protein
MTSGISDNPAMKAYINDGKVTITASVDGSALVPVLTALLIYCTEEMLSRQKVISGQDDTVNFLIGAYLISNRVYQDAVYEKVEQKQTPTEGGVKFV